MQQFCLYGSVRGVPGNQHPYRDKSPKIVKNAPVSY